LPRNEAFQLDFYKGEVRARSDFQDTATTLQLCHIFDHTENLNSSKIVTSLTQNTMHDLKFGNELKRKVKMLGYFIYSCKHLLCMPTVNIYSAYILHVGCTLDRKCTESPHCMHDDHI
jgi:hypothetical protein